MKYIHSEAIDEIQGKKVSKEDRFSFKCHSEISCFNQCCRNIKLFLYPYDVIRLKHHLSVDSERFLDTYTDIIFRQGNYFPEVLLRMKQDADMSCPFLNEYGCSVYENRPDTCRNFPIEQGIMYNAEHNTVEILYWFRPPDFCQGQYETHSLTVVDFLKNQGADIYQKMTMEWAEIKRLFQNDPWGKDGKNGRLAKMAFMAAYNMDEFRNFIFNSTFLNRYSIPIAQLKMIKTDDVALLELGLNWIKFFLWKLPVAPFK